MKKNRKCIILIPTYNDWFSLNKLLKEINKNASKIKREIEILIANDASTTELDITQPKLKKIKKISVISLIVNSGSQLAIAAGLNFIRKKKVKSDVLVLDSDGEDDPKKISNLLRLLETNRDNVIVASRSKRQENFLLKFLNIIRLNVTYLFTGKMINFGNFSCFDTKIINKISKKKELNLSFSGTIQKYCNIKKIPIQKNKRYYGVSKVSINFLILYSLQIISIFKFEVLKRSIVLLMLTLFLIILFQLNINFLALTLVFFLFNLFIFYINYKAKNIDYLNLLKSKIIKIK